MASWAFCDFLLGGGPGHLLPLYMSMATKYLTVSCTILTSEIYALTVLVND